MNSKFFTSGILAGACVGIAATVYLKVGGILGAFMFSLGLLSVIVLSLPLFTGQAQNVWRPVRNNYALLGLMLLLNIAGCAILAALTSAPDITEASEAIISVRLAKGPLMDGLLSIPCGFLMTAAVRGRTLHGTWLPLLLGVPAFIVCGFPHCVADSYYYASCSKAFLVEHAPEALAAYLPTVLGNFIGCNLYRCALDAPAWLPSESTVERRLPASEPAKEQSIIKQAEK